MATDAVTFLRRYASGTLTVSLDQQLSVLDRRLRRVSRRYTRLTKSEKRNPKLEKYECCVDEVMDWLDEGELTVNQEYDVEIERIQEQLHIAEVMGRQSCIFFYFLAFSSFFAPFTFSSSHSLFCSLFLFFMHSFLLP